MKKQVKRSLFMLVVMLSAILPYSYGADNKKNIAAQQVSLTAADTAAWQEVMQKASQFNRRSPRIFVFSRAQLKYGLELNNYIHKWIDRPLYVDPALAQGDGFIKIGSYKKMHDIVQSYGLDGFAFFPETKGRKELFDVCRTPGYEMTILPEFTGPASTAGEMDDKLKIAEAALNNPNSFRLDGKVVFTSYTPCPIESWSSMQSAIRAKYGDKFIFLPSNSFYPPKFKASGTDGKLTAKDIASIQDYLRQWLRVADGFYYNSLSLNADRRYVAEVDREILIPIVKSVLSEPEFKNKHLGWGAKVGHENFEIIGYGMDSAGTGMLRGTMETAIMADGDFINCIEWDEQNENTSFRPTVCNSLSTMRIVRYYTEKLKGRKISPIPTDNLKIPNMILSYREILVAGQKLELEVVNVPDSDLSGEYAIKLSLKDLAGKAVHEFPEQKMACNKLESCFLSVPVEKLLEYQVLIPELEINGPQGKYLQQTGLQPIELRASKNWDFKWIKQPLRDLLKPDKANLSISRSKQIEGFYQLEGSFAAEEPLAYVEVMDCGDVIYSHSNKAFQWRETETHVVVNINWQSLYGHTFKLNGSIELSGVEGQWLSLDNSIDCAGQKLSFKNSLINHLRQVWVAIERKDIKNASFKVDLPGIHQGEIKVADILGKEVMAFPGKQGFNLVFKRYCSQPVIPDHLNTKSAEFIIMAKPANSNSVLYLQAIAQSGKIYRGNTISMHRKTGNSTPLTVYSLSEGKPVTLKVDESLITKIHYYFDPEHGSALISKEYNCDLWGIAGGFRPQIVGRGGAYGYGCPIQSNFSRLPSADVQCNTAPEWIKIDSGEWALKFSDYSYLSLPQMFVPAFSSFVLSMDVYSNNNKGIRPLLDARATAFSLSLNNGELESSYYQNQKVLDLKGPVASCKTGLKLPEKTWSQVKVYFDQQNLIFEVNGKKSKVFPCSGYNRYTCVYSLGSNAGSAFFDGMIKNLVIEHRDL
jgi:hypothetical protein